MRIYYSHFVLNISSPARVGPPYLTHFILHQHNGQLAYQTYHNILLYAVAKKQSCLIYNKLNFTILRQFSY